MPTLGISDVAEETGLAAGTIRMWEQRYGWPVPQRTSGGYRRYTAGDVEALHRVVAFRRRGLSLPAALDLARESEEGSDRPSLYAAIGVTDPAVVARKLRKTTLLALSRAIEDEALARAASPVCFGAFQEERHFRAVEHRYRRLAENADAVVVFADFPAVRKHDDGLVEVPIPEEAALGNEWAVVIDAPGYCASLLAWEQPERDAPEDADRRFETLWTLDPAVTRRAAEAGARLAGLVDAELGDRLTALVEARPPSPEGPSAALTALTNRAIAYLEAV